MDSAFAAQSYATSESNNNRILFVGNIVKHKGIMYGIKAFQLFHKTNPQYVFDIVGKYNENCKYYQSLCRYIDKHKLNSCVMFKGRVDNEKLEWYYSNSDFFLFPSLLEGFGWVMIEAMAHGLPVIAFNNTAMPYTVKNGINGLLAKNRNVIDLAQCMNQIISDKSILDVLKKGAIETYVNSSKMSLLDKKIECYLKTIF